MTNEGAGATTTTDVGAVDPDALLETVRAASGGRDMAVRNTGIRAAVAAGVDLYAIGCAARLSRDWVRQIARTEHTQAMASTYVDGLRGCLTALLARVAEADEATAAAMTIVERMAQFDGITAWRGLGVNLDLKPADRDDLLDDLRSIRCRLRGLRRIAHTTYHTRIDPARVIEWLTLTTAEAPDSDSGETRREEIIRALPAWRGKHAERRHQKPPREWAATYGTDPELYGARDEPTAATFDDDAVTAYVRALAHHYTELRGHAADTARTASIIERYAALIEEFNLRFGIEPEGDDYRDLLGGTWRLERAIRNVDRYHRRFDHGRGALQLTQPSSDSSREHTRQATLERIQEWHRECATAGDRCCYRYRPHKPTRRNAEISHVVTGRRDEHGREGEPR